MRKLLWAPVAAIALVVAGCGSPGEGDDLLFVQGAGGVSVLRPSDNLPRFEARNGVPSYDWKTVVTSERQGRMTYVRATNPQTGIQVWEDVVRGGYRVKIVSGDGKVSALTPSSQLAYKYGRSRSKLAIAGPRSDGTRYITLDGNFDPEAFSTDGKSLFVIKYIPALRPVKYQVRRLDLETERVHKVYTPDAHLQTAMRGTARIQAGSPDGTRLYTLYTLNDGGHLQTFIHVLSLDELWAHCIDLPHTFSAPQEKEVGLAVSKDGERLYVTDSDAGVVAEIDTQDLSVTRTMTTELGQGYEGSRGSTIAAVADDETLFMARGPYVEARDPSDLSKSRSWTFTDSVRGLQIGADGRWLYVALRDEIVTIDLLSGQKIDKVNPPWVGRIKRLGPVIRSLQDREVIKCGC
jgi:hypothetical protein